jgi:hypothetical protein
MLDGHPVMVEQMKVGNETLKNQGDMKQTNKTKQHQKNLFKP